jgi:hypothetical protein
VSRTRMSVRQERETARSLEKSLRATQQGLATLLRSLEGSGFAEALPSYQEMQWVLLQQRLWSRSYRRDELNPLWRKIGETAAAIRAILAPFGAVMDALKDIHRIEPADGAAQPDAPSSTPDEAGMCPDATSEELAALLVETLSLSHVRLCRSLPWSGEERRARLRALVAAGALERRGWGRGQSYRLTAASRRQVAAGLARILQAGRPS